MLISKTSRVEKMPNYETFYVWLGKFTGSVIHTHVILTILDRIGQDFETTGQIQELHSSELYV